MISITKEEAMALRENFGGDVSIAITSRNKRGGRKRYYAEESSRVLNFIKKLREMQICSYDSIKKKDV